MHMEYDVVGGRVMPKYMKLAGSLIAQIESTMKPGDAIASERQLSKELGISRTTVRLAMQHLEKTGYIETMQGKNRIVKDRSAEKIDIGNMFSFTEEMKRLNKQPSSIVLKKEIIEANPQLLARFNLPVGETKLLYLQRLRLADGERLMLEDTYLPVYHFPGLFDKKLETEPLYNILTTEYQVKLMRAVEEVTSITPNNEILEQLKIPDWLPLLQIVRTTNNSKDEIIEYTISVARGDKFYYKIIH